MHTSLAFPPCLPAYGPPLLSLPTLHCRMPTGRWRSQFTYRNKVIQVGMFDSELEVSWVGGWVVVCLCGWRCACPGCVGVGVCVCGRANMCLALAVLPVRCLRSVPGPSWLLLPADCCGLPAPGLRHIPDSAPLQAAQAWDKAAVQYRGALPSSTAAHRLYLLHAHGTGLNLPTPYGLQTVLCQTCWPFCVWLVGRSTAVCHLHQRYQLHTRNLSSPS
jgi:hypothetical protein